MKFSIKVSMVVLFMTISLASVVLMGMLSHYNYSSAVKQDFHTVTEEATKRLNHHMEFYFGQLSKATRTFTNTQLFQRWYEGDPLTNFEQDEIQSQLSRYVALNYAEITGMFLKSADRRVLAMRSSYFTSIEAQDEPWFEVSFSRERILIPTHEITYPQILGMSVITIINPVYSTGTLEPIGSIIIDFNLSEIEAIFERSKLGQTGHFLMVSENDTIVYHPTKEWRGLKLAETPLSVLRMPADGGVSRQSLGGTSMLVSTSSLNLSGWRIVSIVPFDEMASGLYAARNVTVVSFVLIAAMIVFLVPLASGLFIRPVLHLKRKMDKVFQGNYHTRAEFHSGNNEFMKLNYSFNKMVEQLDEQLSTISDLKLEELQGRLRQREAYIQALQNQINPHLLYNSLDVIKSIALLNNDELVVSMAGNLADVYRYTAKISDKEVTLKEELAVLEKYLEITHIRFPKKFQSRIAVDPRFHPCLLIKLTLQPIVENAVKYAVEPRGGHAAIIVSAYSEGNDLIIEIADNGGGIAETEHSEIIRRLEKIV
ncbi:sensor histidine kinase, partial [Cohnella sp.]|uniref:sensor histidine kinase n=1 Tax=Cohnella sp. TaxID=1883426 RepID=UPI003569CA80